MNSHVDMHPIRLRPPYFGTAAQGAIHRYLDPEFVPRFQQDLLTQGFPDNTWQQEDRFSGHDDKVVLRLPMHRCFYLVSCEVACDRLGLPALAPERIASAGFVIRRLAPQGEQSWMLENEKAMGWELSPTGLRDPDLNRRVCRNGRLHRLPGNPAYSGEQAHPLHALVTRDANGKCHTVLYGYLPLGGSYTLQKRAGTTAPPFEGASLALFKSEVARQLPWPYGLKQPLDKSWQDDCTRPINQGVPTAQWVALLKMLVNTHHLGEADIADNHRLEELARNLYFHDDSHSAFGLNPAVYSDYTRQNFTHLRKFSLWSWLQANAVQDPNPLVGWLESQERAMSVNPGGFAFGRLPPKPGAEPLTGSLYMSPGDAQEIRLLLDQRVLDHAVGTAQEIPLPKFSQSLHDVYQIVPFVRVKDDFGGERIVWADSEARSQPFRVAAPFDPYASRPSLIQMPSLKDLRRGMAKGVSLITPADTFSLLNALKLKKGASEDVLPDGEGSKFGMQWICSFSLPVITLVAMILLMIMISLLNIVFFWLPWVRICLPFPKIEKQ